MDSPTDSQPKQPRQPATRRTLERLKENMLHSSRTGSQGLHQSGFMGIIPAIRSGLSHPTRPDNDGRRTVVHSQVNCIDRVSLCFPYPFCLPNYLIPGLSASVRALISQIGAKCYGKNIGICELSPRKERVLDGEAGK